jgi:hypothetical protein
MTTAAWLALEEKDPLLLLMSQEYYSHVPTLRGGPILWATMETWKQASITAQGAWCDHATVSGGETATSGIMERGAQKFKQWGTQAVIVAKLSDPILSGECHYLRITSKQLQVSGWQNALLGLCLSAAWGLLPSRTERCEPSLFSPIGWLTGVVSESVETFRQKAWFPQFLPSSPELLVLWVIYTPLGVDICYPWRHKLGEELWGKKSGKQSNP